MTPVSLTFMSLLNILHAMLPDPFMRAARPSYSVAITRALVFAGNALPPEAKAQVPTNKYKCIFKTNIISNIFSIFNFNTISF